MISNCPFCDEPVELTEDDSPFSKIVRKKGDILYSGYCSRCFHSWLEI